MQATHEFISDSRQTLGRRKNNKSLLDGHSKAVQQVSDLIERVANTSANVLILGESGTGKEVVARSIHTISNRSDKYFVPVNCAAIPQELLESELFGHVKGAFTGAITDRKGRLNLQKEALYFWMKSEIWILICRLNFYVCCKKKFMRELGVESL